MLVQVTATARRFCAGLEIENGRCTEAAPILRRTCLGKTEDELRSLFAARGWKAIVVRDA
jgi:hypothetical protein